MNPRILGIIGGLALVVALLSPFILGSSKKVEQLFEAAETLYEQNDYEGAIGKYKEALKESRKLRARTEAIHEDFTTFVNLKIAMSYDKLAEQSEDANCHYEKALEHVERADQTVKLAEYEERLIYLWGYILHKTGQLKQALEKLTRLIENFPNSPFVENAQEIIVQIKEQLEVSEDNTEEVIPPPDRRIPLWINDPSKFEAFNKKRNTTLVVSNRLRAEKEYVEAAEQYEDFANTNPSTTETAYALYWSGWCYYKGASDDTVILNKSCLVFQRLVDNHSNSPYIYKGSEKLIEIKNLKLKSESTKAIIAAEEAVLRVQQSDCKSDAIPKAITHLGNAKREQEQGNYAAALTLANETQTIVYNTIDNHETAKHYVNQGYTYFNQNQLRRAAKKARDALDVDPPYQNAKDLLEKIKQKYFDQGINYIQVEEYAPAIPLLIEALNIEPFKEGYYQLGRAYLKLGEFEKAKEACEAALAIDPTYEDARRLCASIAD